MSERFRVGNYVIISPVKDEEQHVERTLLSVIRQSLRPRRWIIVDDGSEDSTPEILKQYSQNNPWITLIPLLRRGERKPGSAVINAFMIGQDQIVNDDFDFIVKLDCDLDIPADYFEKLVSKFNADSRLGIASGIYLEGDECGWIPVQMPEYHAAGCSKMVRMRCFREIGGFVPERGWDTVDEIRAQMKGWTTRHFEDLKLHHLKREGIGIGSNRTNMMHGQIYYRTGGGFFFFCFKVIHRAVLGKPAFIGGLMMFVGYMLQWLRGQPKLVTTSEAAQYRHLLNSRLVRSVQSLTNRTAARI